MELYRAPPKTSVAFVGLLANGHPGSAGETVDEYAGVGKHPKVFAHTGIFAPPCAKRRQRPQWEPRLNKSNVAHGIQGSKFDPCGIE